MSSWTRQKGFPVIHVNRNYSTGTIDLHQERYFTVKPTTPDSTKWWIPLNFVTGNESDFSSTTAAEWFPGTDATRVITQTNNRTWTNDEYIILNSQSTGYYRVQYDARNYELIAAALESNVNKIHLVNRAQLIDDAFDFAKTGRLSYAIPLNLTSYLEHDLEYVPWTAANRGLTYLNRVLAGSKNYHQFQVTY